MKKHIKKILTWGRELALISAILLIVSAFMPWGETELVSVNGLNGDGLITIGLGLLAFVLLFIKHVPLWISFIIGAIGLIVGIVDFGAMARASESIGGEVGSGLYLVITSSVGVVAGVVIEMIEERNKKLKKNLFYLDEE